MRGTCCFGIFNNRFTGLFARSFRGSCFRTGNVNGLGGLLCLPLLDERLVAHHLDTGLVDLERHVSEPLGVEGDHPRGVLVMIRRSEENSAHAALGDHREVSLRRFGRDGGFPVELLEVFGEKVRDRLLAGLPHGSVCFGAIQVCRLVILRLKTHAVAIGKLDDQAGKLEERVGFGARADLLGDSLDGTGFGKKL